MHLSPTSKLGYLSFKNVLIAGYTVRIRLTLEDCQIVDLYVDEYGRVTYNSIKICYQIL